MEGVSNNSYIDRMRWKEGEGAEYVDPADQQRLEQEDFFKLLTQQLNMQDPTKPADNDQMIAQMTNFSMAEGISDLSSQFTKFSEKMTSNQALQASTLVGRSVLVPTNKAMVEEGGMAKGMVATQQTAQNVRISVEDASGQVVRTINVGDIDAGTQDFQWDGLDEAGNPLPEGNYTFTANARIGNSNEELPLQMNATVQSVSMGGERGIVLNLKGLGGINFADVTEIS
ncbi:flagellar hook assembly protein FlgD [Idiomarina seosinensis]|uniref:Basal-body rod modification protein FlgD n=1 Tax=Idiomarina seosinensis TaxID=281739 RepID=A0A432ZGU0_9GAMM|nr:flagellar hook assembly protein FlgD [Idiomarina seosinensis]RUO77030.1 flagellar hook assembly protein FlgD [Idiomarina seosinensis]